VISEDDLMFRFDPNDFESEYGIGTPYFRTSDVESAGVDLSATRIEFEVRPRGAPLNSATVSGLANRNARGDRFYISGGLPANWPRGGIEVRFRAVPRFLH
jgi:hypothetical protein